MKAMLLAAGEGTRLRPHTLKCPKPAIPFLNLPLGFYSFPFLRSAGVTDLVVNTFHLPELIQSLYQNQNWFSTEFSHEVGKILGSGGGLSKARHHFLKDKNFFLLNCDEVFATKNKDLFSDLKSLHESQEVLSTLLVMDHPDVGTRFGGVWVDSHNHVVGFGKTKPTGAMKGYHFTGVQILSQDIFQFLPEGAESNILYDGLMLGIQKGHRVQIQVIECDWFETGNPQDFLLATHQVLQKLVQGNPNYKLISDFLKEMDPHFEIQRLGEGLFLKAHSSKIENCEIHDFAVIGANAHLKDCKIRQSVIGNGAMIKGEFLDHTIRI